MINKKSSRTFVNAPQQVIRLETRGATFSVDAGSRRIVGLAVPFGAVGVSAGVRYTFSAGSLTWPADVSRVKLLIGHDYDRAVGNVSQFTETQAGLLASFRIARGPAGDEALAMAGDGVWDGLSLGLGRGKFRATSDAVGPLLAGVSVPIMEVSLTPFPAFTDARVESVDAGDQAGDQQAGDQQAGDQQAGDQADTPNAALALLLS